MAKRQTRRTISINRQLFDDAKTHAAGLGVPFAAFTEHALRILMADRKVKGSDIAVASVLIQQQHRINALFKAADRIRVPHPAGRPVGAGAVDPNSKTQRAVALVRAGEISASEAARRLGITRQAVSHAMQREERNHGR